MRVLATFCASFAAGIFLAQYGMAADWLPFAAAVAFLAACGRLVLPRPVGRRVLLIGVGLCLAFGYDWLYIRQVVQPAQLRVGTQSPAVMTVCAPPAETHFGARVTVRAEGIPGKVVYYGDRALLELRPGQTISDTVQFRSASRIRDDDVTNFTSKGIFLLAYGRGEPRYGAGSMDAPRWWPVRVGAAMQEQIDTIFSGDTAAFLTAILTGDPSHLSVQASTDLSEAGLYHLLAVSGMHCGFLMTMVVLLTGHHRRRLTAGVTIGLLIFYGFLTGGSPSVVRACVMLSFLLAAPLFQRCSDAPTALSAALMLLLVSNPFAAASISLQLSFSATAGILWLTPKLQRLLLRGKKRGKLYHVVASSFSATMGALVLTTPIAAIYFGRIVLISPVSNLLCLWAAGIVFGLGLLAVLLSFLWLPLGTVVAVVPRLLASYMLGTAHLLAGVPYHAIYTVNPYWMLWLGFAYLLFAVAYGRKAESGRTYALAAALSVGTLAVTVYLGAARYSSAMDAEVLDVGQGQCVLLASEGQFALADCGSGNSWYHAGGIAADHLLTMGCRKLDYLILTHYDEDHINGAETLFSRLDVSELLLPIPTENEARKEELLDLAEKYQVTVRFISQREPLPLGLAELMVYPPLGKGADNEMGLTILASYQDTDLLITGDMSSDTERILLRSYPLPDLEYLVAGHHGSKYSTSQELLDTLRPETVLISAGSNSYGHPAEETLWRLTEHECEIYCTRQHGDIHLSIN